MTYEQKISAIIEVLESVGFEWEDDELRRLAVRMLNKLEPERLGMSVHKAYCSYYEGGNCSCP